MERDQRRQRAERLRGPRRREPSGLRRIHLGGRSSGGGAAMMVRHQLTQKDLEPRKLTESGNRSHVPTAPRDLWRPDVGSTEI